MEPGQLFNEAWNAVLGLGRLLLVFFRFFHGGGCLFLQGLVAGKTERVCLFVGGAAVRASDFFNDVGGFTLPPAAKAIVQGFGILRPANAFPLRLRLWLPIRIHGSVRLCGRLVQIGTEPNHQQADNAQEKSPGKAAVISLCGGYIGTDYPKDDALKYVSDQQRPHDFILLQHPLGISYPE